MLPMLMLPRLPRLLLLILPPLLLMRLNLQASSSPNRGDWKF
jgi:hypothetical protein